MLVSLLYTQTLYLPMEDPIFPKHASVLTYKETVTGKCAAFYIKQRGYQNENWKTPLQEEKNDR